MEVVILAAGKGTRMNSSSPKVLHEIGGRPMLSHVISTALELKPNKIHIVVGFGADQVATKIEDEFPDVPVNWVTQSEQLGTGHALQQALPDINTDSDDNPVLVLFGDVPFIREETLSAMLLESQAGQLSLLTFEANPPAGFGRIIRDSDGSVTAIVEERDASVAQKLIGEVNSGIMAIPAQALPSWLRSLGNNNDQGEYYLTDIIALAHSQGVAIRALMAQDEMEVMGVNDKVQLALLERHLQKTIANDLMKDGVTLRDPARIDVRGTLHCGKDVVVDVNSVFEGEVSLGDGVSIGPNCVIKNARIAAGTVILAGTNIEDAEIGPQASIGPLARLRPGTRLGANTKIGNFVETKNAIIGDGSKANHLAYLGDVELGSGCNIGAGTIVCNYDGVNKHKTKLGDNVFIGSNSVLIAPVKLADNAFVAAGSAVTSDVPSDSLAVARVKQRVIAGWKRPSKG